MQPSEVTVEAKSETANSMAVIRTGDSLELRRVVLKSFARGEIVSVSAANKGRVLLSGSTARDFKINELVNAVIVADAKGQVDRSFAEQQSQSCCPRGRSNG